MTYFDPPRFGPRQPTEEQDREAAEEASRIISAAIKKLKEKQGTMHYRNGREAKNGDKVVQVSTFYDTEGKPYCGLTAVGVLYDAKPGNDYCNGNIAPIQSATTGACMCDCLHVDDIAAMLAEKGLDKRPAGK